MGPGSAGRGATRGTLKQPTPEARPGAGENATTERREAPARRKMRGTTGYRQRLSALRPPRNLRGACPREGGGPLPRAPWGTG